MKKIYWFTNVFLLGVMFMLTSCLGEGSTGYTNLGSYGVVRIDDNFVKVIDVFSYYHYPVVYSDHEFLQQNMDEGTCCYIIYDLDLDDPVNSQSSLQAKGYYTIVLKDAAIINRYTMSNGILTDTSEVLTGETTLDKVGIETYINGKLFILHSLTKGAPDQEERFDLSYDAQNMVTKEDGKSIYDVFLRCIVSKEGTKTPIEKKPAIATYEIKNYLEYVAHREQGEGNTEGDFYIRFNFRSKDDKGNMFWTQSDKLLPVKVKDILR